MKNSLSILLVVLMTLSMFTVCAYAQEPETFNAGDKILYGSYPQSLVEDPEKITELDAIEKNDWVRTQFYREGVFANEDLNEDWQYSDMDIDGDGFYDYRAVINNNLTSYQENHFIEVGKTYYYAFEPLSWVVLDPHTGLVMTESAIDNRRFNDYYYIADHINGPTYRDTDCLYLANNYYESDIRHWLNNDFVSVAFSETQADNIRIDRVDNSVNSGAPEGYECQDSFDKVFLMSQSEFDNYITYTYDIANESDYTTKRNTIYRLWLRTPDTTALGETTECLLKSYKNGQSYYGLTYNSVNYCEGIRPLCRLNELRNDVGNICEHTDTNYDGWCDNCGIKYIPPVGEAIIDRGSCGYATSYILREDGSLTITADFVSDETMIDQYSFTKGTYLYSNLIRTVDIGDGITTIGEDAFADCENLVKVKVGKDVKEIIYGAFFRCKNLEEIILAEGIETINSPFYGCVKLKEINIPASAKEFPLVNSNLEAINVDENNPYFKSIDGVVYSKDGTTLIRCPEMKPGRVYTVAPGTTKISEGAFFQCANIEEIILPETIEEIGGEAFYMMTSLKHINIPDSVTKIGELAFAYCVCLKEITIPSSVSEIEMGLLAICVSLETVNLPENLERIGEKSFATCISLQNITIPETVNDIEKDAFINAGVINATVLSQGTQMENSGFGTVVCMNEDIENVVDIYTRISALMLENLHGYIDYETYEEELSLMEEELNNYYIYYDELDMIPLENQPTVIIGHQGSTAQAYAQANDLDFTSCPLGEHTNIQYNTDGYEATCTEVGFIGGSACLDCETVIEMPQIIPAKGHRIVTDPAIPATCVSTGLTEGQHCSRCDEIIVPQTSIPAKEHVDSDGDGVCDNCGNPTDIEIPVRVTFIERIQRAFSNIINSIISLFKRIFG